MKLSCHFNLDFKTKKKLKSNIIFKSINSNKAYSVIALILKKISHFWKVKKIWMKFPKMYFKLDTIFNHTSVVQFDSHSIYMSWMKIKKWIID